MTSYFLKVCSIVAMLTLLGGNVSAQGDITNNFKFNISQSVQPIFEGWSWATDGSINMHFGYLNRNYAQELTIPVGVDNNIQPGGPDMGQPTFFYTRTQRNLFVVNVPKNGDIKREVIWTVTANGKTEKAIGWLQAEWEIDPAGGAGGSGGNTSAEHKLNQPPTIFGISYMIDSALPVTLSDVGTLIAVITDDGLPIPRPRNKPAVGQETPPGLQGGSDAPVNVPSVAGVIREPPSSDEKPLGLNVSWIVWRGPAAATFSPQFAEPAKSIWNSGTTNATGCPTLMSSTRVSGSGAMSPLVTVVCRLSTKTTVIFSTPGEYVLRAKATDTFKAVTADVQVIVQ